ncbi:MAG TPA: 2,3-bisphosphoglycerate-independent phosphoglycerate mutase [Candidatus Limivicinus faecipullorum]|nr:2,3-bisphosphoglycerate-independent phosphoglycerate mutase [Candidatus Limivicinus faecipullorum]
MTKKAVLIILDGYGLAAPTAGNAIAQAKKPNLDRLFSQNPSSKLSASGLDVGLPQGQMGNSEVGHTNIGAGRVVFQILPKMSQEIENGKFFENPVYIKAMEDAKANGKALHILGLMSTGGVHSHLSHVFGILDMAKQRGVEKVYVHCFLDGRDVAPKSGAGFIKQLKEKCDELGNARIATVQGRFYGMDRDKRWDRVEQGYNAIVCGEGIADADPVHAIEESYAQEVTDEFVKPVVCCSEGVINQGDSVIFMNFRPDRAREMTWALNLPDFDGFQRKKTVYPLSYVCTAQYDETLPLPIAYPPEVIENTLGDYISAHGLKQFRVAETEKYAHVTFFFNGGVEKQTEGEERCLVPSPKEFATYDLVPEMSARKVADKCVEAIASDKYDLVVCNFANCDMVGHTGVMDAAVKAVETVDECMGRIMEETAKHPDTVLVVTADHGNADCMFDENGKVNTAHTTNKVPFTVCMPGISLKDGKLADIAPTILEIMGLKQPEEMTGESLIVK